MNHVHVRQWGRPVIVCIDFLIVYVGAAKSLIASMAPPNSHFELIAWII